MNVYSALRVEAMTAGGYLISYTPAHQIDEAPPPDQPVAAFTTLHEACKFVLESLIEPAPPQPAGDET